MMAQMALANVPNEVLAFNPFTTSPPAVNQGICLQFPDTMCTPEMCWNTFACSVSAARLRVTLAGPLAKCCRQAGIGPLCRGYKWMRFGQVHSFWSSRHLSYMGVVVAQSMSVSCLPHPLAPHQHHGSPSRECYHSAIVFISV
jgi:hypothetical protein